MSVYLCLLIPFFNIAVLFFFFRSKTIWWEFIIPIVGSFIFIFVAKYVAVQALVSDTQFLGGYAKEVRYYEPWNEKVHCRHAKYCSKYSCSGSGKNRSCGMKSYQCGWQHMYDVDYHPEYWSVVTTFGENTISKTRHDEILRKKFKVSPTFQDLHRNYHTINGNMYFGRWDGKDETLEPVVIDESYENRPKASRSVYRFQELDSFDIKEYHPFNYPAIDSYQHQVALLGYNDPVAERKLQILNSRLGIKKHVKVFVVVFKNKTMDAGRIQERYWEGSNKNEYIITVGINDQNKVIWAYDFSWTEVAETKVDTENFIQNQEVLDLPSIVDFVYGELEAKWIPRDFHEFDVLTIQPSMTAIIIILFLTLALNGGMSYWIITNEFDDENPKGDYRY